MAQRRMGIIALFLCVCLFLLPCTARAASVTDSTPPLHTNKDCTLSLFYRYEASGFSGLDVKLYKVADVSADVRFSLTAPFEPSALSLNGIRTSGEWNVVRSTLEAYILTENVAPTASAVTDAIGQVRFDALKPGLYLAITERIEMDGYSYNFENALITLPGLDADGLWEYDLSVMPKVTRSELPPPGPGPDPDPPTPPGPGPGPKPGKEITLKVLKLWKGDEGREDRPESVEVEIFRDGASYQSVVLSEENHWSYAWTVKDDGASWIAAEKNVPEGYAATLDERDGSFVLTNTRLADTPPADDPTDEPTDEPADTPPADEPSQEPPKDTPSTDIPKTGDTPHIMLYTVLMYVSGFVLILLGITGKRKSE